MKREIIVTSDGSTSIHLPEWNESYHSKHGAIQEAYHVFIKNGLSQFESQQSVSILEIGFGTGLNCFITYVESKKRHLRIDYTGVEAYPVSKEDALQMNFAAKIDEAESSLFERLHAAPWEEKITISDTFSIVKRNLLFEKIQDEGLYDLIYFDAFGYRVQPELWSEAIFKIMYKALRSKGVLVTYACRTVIKDAMKKAGFTIEKLPGAPGKREMLRAIKNE